jgi:hypothetical protein
VAQWPPAVLAAALNSGADVWATASASIELHAGRNLITVFGSDHGAEVDLDYITVGPAPVKVA